MTTLHPSSFIIMVTANNLPLWGRLQPILPFHYTNSHPTDPYKDVCLSDGPSKLTLPGNFGREALLRPFLDGCPCLFRHHQGRLPNEEADGDSSKRKRCRDCRSIHSLAKFIPRRNLLEFAYEMCHEKQPLVDVDVQHDDTVTRPRQMILKISGSNATQIVHLRRATDEVNQSASQSSTSSKYEVRDMDEVSLYWGELGIAAATTDGDEDEESTSPSSLLRFRIVRMTNEVGAAHTVTDDAQPNQQQAVQPALSEGVVHDNNNNNNNNNKSATAQHEDEPMASKAINTAGSHDNPSQRKEDDVNINIDSTKPSHKAIKSPTIPDSDTPSSATSNIDDRKAHYASIDEACNNSLACESEESSAPLTLPTYFLATCSRSFSYDSSQRSQSPASKTSYYKQVDGDDTTLINETSTKRNWKKDGSGEYQTTPQKSIRSGKRKAGSDDDDATMPTPKKSNVTADVARKTLRSMLALEAEGEANNTSSDDGKSTVLLSSLSYDQILKLHQDTNNEIASQQPALRKAVLSLTLALTSNASSWDSAFLKQCRANDKVTSHRHGTTPDGNQQRPSSSTNTKASSKGSLMKQQWIPRLLQGTNIVLNTRDDTVQVDR